MGRMQFWERGEVCTEAGSRLGCRLRVYGLGFTILGFLESGVACSPNYL